jgi:hypothetical protein
MKHTPFYSTQNNLRYVQQVYTTSNLWAPWGPPEMYGAIQHPGQPFSKEGAVLGGIRAHEIPLSRQSCPHAIYSSKKLVTT